MLVGTANIEVLAATAPTIPQWRSDSVVLTNVHCLQITAELNNAARQAVLPPSLHPTVPPAISLQALKVEDSLWGKFDLVIARVFCRSGVRARGFTMRAFASSKTAVNGLSTTFGFPALAADIHFRHGYDGADLEVVYQGSTCLSARAIHPEPMGPDDVQYTSTLNLAHTPNGLRLVQVEASHVAEKVDRLTASLPVFDGEAFGSDMLQISGVVSASLAKEQVEYPGIRFVCKADELAFTGTEPVAAK